MAMTPEGRVKKSVKEVLARYPHYGLWPVPGGYGESTLDYLGCINGRFFAIETKRPGKKPTDRQTQIASRINRAGGPVFIIDNAAGDELRELEEWLAYQNAAPQNHDPRQRQA